MIVQNGMVALPNQGKPVRADLRIEEGRFAEIAPTLPSRKGEERVNAQGLLILPGGIDPHVHFDTPGFTEREDFLHGSAEAARGGVTTVIDMPCTSLPPVVSAEALKNKLSHIAPLALVDYGLYGGIAGTARNAGPSRLAGNAGTSRLAGNAGAALATGIAGRRGSEGADQNGRLRISRAMEELADRVLGFKTYLLSGMETFPQVNFDELEWAITEAARLSRPLLLHAEDPNYVALATERLRRLHGETGTWDDYVDSRSEAAELMAVAAALALARGREGTLHVVHVSTAEAAEALSAAGATCETCGHYLAFSREDFAAQGSSLKTAPPVKGKPNQKRLWELLSRGTIAFVSSDHAPARPEEKRTGSVWTDYGGIPGVGTLVPYLFSEGYLAGRLSLPRFLEAIAMSAARRYGLDLRKGSIEVGKDADFTLINPQEQYVFQAKNLYSKGKDTPFDGMILRGLIRSTWLRGQRIYSTEQEDSKPGPYADVPLIRVEGGFGKNLTWGYR